jgi:hypothetical protein
MVRIIRYIIGALLSAAVALPYSTAEAQGWVRLPNGELGYKVDYTSTGYFYCSNYFIPKTSCSAHGNSVTLTNAGNALTMTYVGFQHSVVASNGQRTPIGYIQTTYLGTGPFTFPSTAAPNAWYLGFNLNLIASAPMLMNGWWGLGYAMQNNTLSMINRYGWGYLAFPVTPPPPPATYNALVFQDLSNSPITAGNSLTYIDATALITPEPATIILTASGLAATFAALRRRRRR